MVNKTIIYFSCEDWIEKSVSLSLLCSQYYSRTKDLGKIYRGSIMSAPLIVDIEDLTRVLMFH